jgi:hypothetical protein
MRFFRRRRRQRAQPIGEAEAYRRSYGTPSADVTIVKLPPRRPRDPDVLANGEVLRLAFLERLQRRENGTEKSTDRGRDK